VDALFTPYFLQQNFITPNRFRLKFDVQKVFGVMHLLAQKLFGVKKLFGVRKLFGVKKVFSWKKLIVVKSAFFGVTKILV